ncbi:MAG: hypothetical protein HY275_06535 [Gemmatimonadetes bacterium]|nr:hypothetical protein [Gemmatimonadota bacterium]
MLPTQEFNVKQHHRAAEKPAARPSEEETRDLGFGSVVATQARERLLNPDGSFNVRRTGLGFWETVTPYHVLVTMSWPRFLWLSGALFMIINVSFGLVYWALGPSALLSPGSEKFGGDFLQAFFFSVETFATIGYGHVAPMGIPANLVMTAESIVGVLAQALVTGFTFARFARPTAAILFSRNAIIAPYRGGSALMFRIVNRRSNQIIELHAQAMLARMEQTPTGKKRTFSQMSLERARVVFFPLSWTVVHPIDEQSPFWGISEDQLRAMDAEILILLSGYDETFAQQVHTRSSYKADEVVWNARFKNIFDTRDANGDVALDVSRVHEFELLDQPI